MAMEIEVANTATEPAEGAIAAGLSAADIINGDGCPATSISNQGDVPVEPTDDEISSTLVASDSDDESTSTTMPEVDIAEQRRIAEVTFDLELHQAKEDHSAAAIHRSECEAELKEAKADEKAALKKIQNLIARGPAYPQQITKIEAAVANDKETKSAIQVDDPNADVTWKLIPITSIIEGIKGMGKKKADAIVELVPTLGDWEELRAQAGKAFKPLASVLPKGIGQSMADEIEERVYAAIKKHTDALNTAKGDEPVEDDELELETEEAESQPEYVDVDDL